VNSMIDLQMFAEDQAEEKREDPTPRRRRKAREQGQVFHSKDVTSAVLLFSVFLLLSFQVVSWGQQVSDFAEEAFSLQRPSDWSTAGVHSLCSSVLQRLLWMLAPLFAVSFFLSLGGTLLQTGLAVSAKPLSPDLKRLDPVQGCKRIFSLRALVNMGKSLIKVVAVGWVAYSTLAGKMVEFPMLLRYPVLPALGRIGEVLQVLMLRCVLVLAVVAVADYYYERAEHEKKLKMTRRELKEEMKETEGDPQVQRRRRSFRDQMARRRMMSDVPDADVVVTNPTQFAVALSYEFAEMDAPRVVAKGRALIANRIMEIARENDVTIRREPPLARALYDAVEVGASIPPHLYEAVAEILAYVWRKQGKGADGEGSERR